MDESQVQVVQAPGHPIQSRWLSTLASLTYQIGHIDTYLEELASGLCHGLGASRILLSRRQESGYRFIFSPELTPESSQNITPYSNLAEDILNQRISNTGMCMLPANLMVAYCGVPIISPRGIRCGIVVALRHSIEPFQINDYHIVTLMASQAAMAIELEQCVSPKEASVAISPRLSLQSQDQLAAENQQLTQKLEHYRTELQRVSTHLQLETIAHAAFEQRFRKVFEGSNDAIFVINPTQDRILEVNSRATQLLNYSRHELLNTISISQIHPDEMKNLLEFSQSVFHKGHGWTDELTYLTKFKTKVSAEISATSIEFEGQPCLLTMVRDISERKRMEGERKQAEATAREAYSHLAEVREFASMLVHEVRNPLTTVLMGLTSFQKLDLDSQFQARLTIALEEAERLKRLLNEILLFSKSPTLTLKPLELNKWSAELLASIQTHPLLTDRIVQFTANPISTIVFADAAKLKQVFINLIFNACEAIPPGEMVTWEIMHPSKADELTVKIQNGGSPIAPTILEKLTKPFFTTKSNGNGLGLAIAKRVITAHGGQLAITSNATVGTTVTIRLPLLKSSQSSI